MTREAHAHRRPASTRCRRNQRTACSSTSAACAVCGAGSVPGSSASACPIPSITISSARHLGDVVLGLLAAGEVRGDRAQEALRVLIVYTIGFAAFAAQPPLDPGDPPLPGAAELRGNFESGLRWLLAGIIAS